MTNKRRNKFAKRSRVSGGMNINFLNERNAQQTKPPPADDYAALGFQRLDSFEAGALQMSKSTVIYCGRCGMDINGTTNVHDCRANG